MAEAIIHLEVSEPELNFLLGIMTSTFQWRYKSTSDHMLLYQRLHQAAEKAAHRRKNAEAQKSSK